MPAAVMTLPDVDDVPVQFLGIDEHRFRTGRWFSRRRHQGVEAGGTVDDHVRESPDRARDRERGRPALRDRHDLAGRTVRPVSVDHWHLVRLTNLMVTAVRQRVAREWLGRRGRATDGAWAHRMLLLRAGNTLSHAPASGSTGCFTHDDPTGELAAA